MSFSVRDSLVALCSGESVVVCNLENGAEFHVELPKLEGEKELKAHNREDIESFHALTCVDFSNDGRYFLVCANRKQLCLYEVEGCKLISNRAIPRAASKVRFLPNNDVVVADKSGDAYLFSTNEPNKKEELLLGHLSMLLDVLVTDDQKHIITADRDEKIRISMFPNSYNILSYCLGHKNFVTSIAVVPHNKDILVSGGGDGTLMFWDYKAGKQLTTVYFHEKLCQDDLVKLNKTLKENDLDDQVMVSPVKHIQLLQIEEYKSIIAVTFYCSNVVLVYSVSKGQRDLNVEFLEIITVNNEPIEIKCNNKQLWILTDLKIHVFTFDKNFVYDENFNSKTEKLNEMWKKLHSTSTKTLLPVLYKRKFDSVQEYKERKKLRLINDSK